MTFTDDGTTEGAAATAASPPTSNTPVPTATDIDQGVGMTGLFKGIDSKGRPLVVGGEAPCDPAMRGGSGRRAVVGYPAADGNRADRRAYQKATRRQPRKAGGGSAADVEIHPLPHSLLTRQPSAPTSRPQGRGTS